MKYPATRYLKNQLRRVPTIESVDLSGRTILVVGANVGLGLEASKHFASMNPARLILACRSKVKGENAIKGLFSLGLSWTLY